jgi:hypothetical protein
MSKEKQQYSNVTVTRELHQKIRMAAAEHRTSIFALMCAIVTEWLNREKEEDQ